MEKEMLVKYVDLLNRCQNNPNMSFTNEEEEFKENMRLLCVKDLEIAKRVREINCTPDQNKRYEIAREYNPSKDKIGNLNDAPYFNNEISDIKTDIEQTSNNQETIVPKENESIEMNQNINNEQTDDDVKQYVIKRKIKKSGYVNVLLLSFITEVWAGFLTVLAIKIISQS